MSSFPNKKVVPSEKVTPSEEVEKDTNSLNDMEDPVHMIRAKDLDKFQGQSIGSTGWFKLDQGWLKIKFSTLEPDFYKKGLKNIEGQDIEAHKNFVVTFYNTKLNLPMRNDSVTSNEEKK